MTDMKFSCIDCGVGNCNKMDGVYPDFCLTTNMDPAVLEDAMSCYAEGSEDRKI